MARFIQPFSATTAVALTTAINTFLATLVNPTIVGIDYMLDRQDGRIGENYNLTLRYDDGGAALATPFLARLDEGQNLAVPTAALKTFMDANAAYFFGGSRAQLIDGEQLFKKYSVLTIYNVTAGASANYTNL